MQIIQTKAIQDAFPSKSVLSAGVCSTMNDLMPMVRCVVRTVQHSVAPCKYSVLSNFSTSCSTSPQHFDDATASMLHGGGAVLRMMSSAGLPPNVALCHKARKVGFGLI